VRVACAAAVIAGGSAERLAVSGRLAEQAVTAAVEAGDPGLSCQALELLAMSLRPGDLTAAGYVLRRELAVAEGAPDDADTAAWATDLRRNARF